MISINQGGTLMCNRVGHNNKYIEAVCITKGCEQPIPCCAKCMIENHKNHEFVDIVKIKEQSSSRLQYLNQLSQLSSSLLNVCQMWKKEIQELIDQFKQTQLMPDNPTLTQLTNEVLILRELNHASSAELIQLYTTHSALIKQTLNDLTNKTNALFQNQVINNNQRESKSLNQQNLKTKNFQFTLTQQLQGHDGEVGFVAISNDDKYIASESDPGKVILWDVKSHQYIAQYETQNEIIDALHFSNDNSMLAVSSYQWMLRDGFNRIIEIFDLTNLKNTQAKIKLEGHSYMIYGITFTDDSKYLISVSLEKSLRVWDLNKKKEINKQECDGELLGVAYSHQQKLIACCGRNGLCYLFDSKNLNNLQLIVKWQAHSQYSSCIEFIRNSTIIMTSSDQETRFWQIEDLLNKKFDHFKEIKEGAWTVKAYPIDNPQVIINCSSDKRFVNLWSYDSTELIQRLEIPDKLSFKSFAITSDFKKIITGGCNTKVKIFHQESGLRRIQ